MHPFAVSRFAKCVTRSTCSVAVGRVAEWGHHMTRPSPLTTPTPRDDQPTLQEQPDTYKHTPNWNPIAGQELQPWVSRLKPSSHSRSLLPCVQQFRHHLVSSIETDRPHPSTDVWYHRRCKWNVSSMSPGVLKLTVVARPCRGYDTCNTTGIEADTAWIHGMLFVAPDPLTFADRN